MTDEQLPTRASLRARRNTAPANAASGADTAAETPPAAATPVQRTSAFAAAASPTPQAEEPLGEPSVDAGIGAGAPPAAIPTVETSTLDHVATSSLPSHARTHRSHRVARGIALTVAGVLVFSTAAAATVYNQLRGNVKTANVGDLLKTSNPTAAFTPPSDPNSGTALNYLLLGSDRRDGVVKDGVQGMRSDTAMVMHISKDRSRIDVISIPRDSMVSIPSCKLTNGKSTSATFGMFNEAFAYGADQGGDVESAIACTWATVEKNTGIKLDGAALVEMKAFESVVNALGGVYMCIPEETISKDAGNLHLQAGWQTLNGKNALGYARARKGVGQNFDGSDTNRTGRQQQLLAAIINQVLNENSLTSVTKLYTMVDAVTKSLTVTETLSNTKNLVALAYSLRSIRSKNITFMTIPFQAYAPDPNRIEWSSAADEVWKNIDNDKPIAKASKSPASTSTSSSTKKPTTVETKTPVREAFTAGDTTAVCADPK